MLTALIVAMTVAALVSARRATPEGRPDRHGRTDRGGRAGRSIRAAVRDHSRSPAAAFAAVTCSIYVNQVLFTVYVSRVRHGDVSFVARYLPEGWFDLPNGPVIEALARHFPAPELLAPTVLRVQAFWELPFVVFGYLTVCRWFSPWVYRRARGLVWLVSVSYTATFCLIEWHFANPYTVDDVVIRIAAAVVVPLWVARFVSASAPCYPRDLPGLLIFAVSAAGFGLIVLVVYDTALLYNLGHLDTRSSLAVLALLAVAAARFTVRSRPDRRPGRGLDSIASSLGWLLVLFFVPALPIRYGLGFGAVPVSAAATLVLVAFAAGYGVREAFARAPGRPRRWALQMAAALAAGVPGAAATLLIPAENRETRLLWAASAFFGCAVSVCAFIDRKSGDVASSPGQDPG